MALQHVLRVWKAPGGWDGPRFEADQVRRFERLMQRHAPTLRSGRWHKPTKGYPALVSSWDDGRSAECWYTARVGPEERALREQCTRIFGVESSPFETC